MTSEGLVSTLKTLREQVFKTIEQIYQTEPAWIPNTTYYIDWSGTNWHFVFPQTADFYSEFVTKELETIELIRHRPRKSKRRREVLTAILALKQASQVTSQESS